MKLNLVRLSPDICASRTVNSSVSLMDESQLSIPKRGEKKLKVLIIREVT